MLLPHPEICRGRHEDWPQPHRAGAPGWPSGGASRPGAPSREIAQRGRSAATGPAGHPPAAPSRRANETHCDAYNDSLSKSNKNDYWNLGVLTGVVLKGNLSCPANPSVDFDLYLQVNRSGTTWTTVAQSIGIACLEEITFDVGASQDNGRRFRWRVARYSGNGTYHLDSCY